MSNYEESIFMTDTSYGNFYIDLENIVSFKYKYLPKYLIDKKIKISFTKINNKSEVTLTDNMLYLFTKITSTYGKFYLKDGNNTYIRFDFKYLLEKYLNTDICVILQEV